MVHVFCLRKVLLSQRPFLYPTCFPFVSFRSRFSSKLLLPRLLLYPEIVKLPRRCTYSLCNLFASLLSPFAIMSIQDSGIFSPCGKICSMVQTYCFPCIAHRSTAC